MYDHCKKILPLLVILIGTLPLSAASLRWVQLGKRDSGLVSMAMDGKIVFRKMPPRSATPWGKVPAGLHRFQIGSEDKPGAPFELNIAEEHKVTIISFTDDNGNIQSRTLGIDPSQSQIYVLNLLPGAMMSLPETKKKAILGKGFWLPEGQNKTTISFADLEGFHCEVDFSLLNDSPVAPYLAVLFKNDEGKPNLAILRTQDSLFEIGEESFVIEDEFAAIIRIISAGRVLAAGSFDPSLINWTVVNSRIFWLNFALIRDTCRLEINGFPAIRRMPSGRGSSFSKWPVGVWGADIAVERTNEKVSRSNFTLAAKSSIGLISSGGGKYPNRLLTVEGRTSEEGTSKLKPQIRFVNALPDGVLRSIVPSDAEPIVTFLKPGEMSNIIPLEKGIFPGAKLDLTVGKAKGKLIVNIPAMPSLPSGDWVVVIHLDQESFTTPVLTWVEMDKGAITFPDTPEAEE